MAQETRHINISDLGPAPGWEHLIAEVKSTKQSAIIDADGEDAVELRPAPKRRTRIPRGKPITADDSLWAIIGIADVKETDIAENHDKYLADAYADTHE